MSFIARATCLRRGIDDNAVTLHDLSFAPGTASFNVYRGPNPSQLLRIAKEEADRPQWIDNGAEEELAAPPDANYHHANFYWRLNFCRRLRREITIGEQPSAMRNCGCSPMSIEESSFGSAREKAAARSARFFRIRTRSLRSNQVDGRAGCDEQFRCGGANLEFCSVD